MASDRHEGSLEVRPIIQHENEAENLPELRAIHPSLWVGVLAYDRVRHVQAVLLPHNNYYLLFIEGLYVIAPSIAQSHLRAFH